ncbi:GFA family protein [Devosia alba]|uniref:GFA family protein n=1 Tax=Devosia alba TaxID=3152360 RepID=UPI0032661135
MLLFATCHCGATSIALPHLPTQAKQCNCSYCARTGAVWGYFGSDELDIRANDDERTYSASDGVNQHHFCGHCGMQTWGESPDWASMYNMDGTPKNPDATGIPATRSYAVNLRLIDDLDWSKLDIEQIDGRNSW